MDPSAFDALVRAFATGGTRRRLVRLLAALPLGGALVGLGQEAGAEKPHERLGRRTEQRNRKQRNERRRNNKNNNKNNKNRNNKNNKNRNNKNNNNGGGGGGGNPGPCTPTGQACQENSDCCTNNCFDFVCAAPVTQCGQGSGATPCTPAANGCCLFESCCQSPANQCNLEGDCCAPNCQGRQCGDDGCGNGGTCGSCAPGQTCSANGKCQGKATCSPQNCANGCCDKNGKCQPGNIEQACGTDGNPCKVCQGATCESGLCLTCTAANCPNGCCDAQSQCQPGQGSCFGPGGSCCAGCCDGQACRPGTANGACGANAEVCVSCLTDEGPGDCVDGRCVCDAVICPFGCCEHGPGQPGQCITDDPRFCGAVGGVQCLICPAGTSCSAQGQCVCSPSCPRCQTCNAVTGQCQPVVCPPPADQCHAAGTCDPGTGECSYPSVANGTPCIDSNPLCINGQCCTAGHEVINGGCFQITQITNGVCTGCSDACQTCGGSIDGSPNFLCGNKTTNGCQGNAECPVGQACQTQIDTCLAPC